MTKSVSRQNDGAALFLVLMLIAALTALSSAFIVRVHQTNHSGSDSENEAIARSAAQSGIEMAKALIIAGRAKEKLTENVRVGEGDAVIEVQPEAASRYSVSSTGRYSAEGVEVARVTYQCVLAVHGPRVAVESLTRIHDTDSHS